MSLHQRVVAALEDVVDPCSVAANAPVPLADLGLLDLAVDEVTGDVAVSIRLTGPSCVYGPRLVAAVEHALSGVPGVGRVEAGVDHGALWSPERITPAGLATLAAARARALGATGTRPRQWEETTPVGS